MAETGKGLLAVWTDIAPEAEADFNAWYDREHLPERAAVPGFLNARLYRLAETAGTAARYFAGYDTERLETLGSPSYVKALDNQTPWSQRMFAHFRNTTRMIAGQIGERGRGLGGAILALRFEMTPGGRERLRAVLDEGLLQSLAGSEDVVRVSVAAGVIAPLGGDAHETALLAEQAPTTCALLVEGGAAESLEALRAERLGDEALAALGAQGPAEGAVYRLVCAITH